MTYILAALLCLAQSAHGGGFVWKPVGAHFPGNAVLVLPHRFVGSKTGVSLLTTGGKRIPCRLKSSGICPGNPECLNRPTYLCAHSGSYIERHYGQVTVRAILGNTCLDYRIKHPSQRTD